MAEEVPRLPKLPEQEREQQAKPSGRRSASRYSKEKLSSARSSAGSRASEYAGSRFPRISSRMSNAPLPAAGPVTDRARGRSSTRNSSSASYYRRYPSEPPPSSIAGSIYSDYAGDPALAADITEAKREHAKLLASLDSLRKESKGKGREWQDEDMGRAMEGNVGAKAELDAARRERRAKLATLEGLASELADLKDDEGWGARNRAGAGPLVSKEERALEDAHVKVAGQELARQQRNHMVARLKAELHGGGLDVDRHRKDLRVISREVAFRQEELRELRREQAEAEKDVQRNKILLGEQTRAWEQRVKDRRRQQKELRRIAEEDSERRAAVAREREARREALLSQVSSQQAVDVMSALGVANEKRGAFEAKFEKLLSLASKRRENEFEQEADVSPEALVRFFEEVREREEEGKRQGAEREADAAKMRRQIVALSAERTELDLKGTHEMSARELDGVQEKLDDATQVLTDRKAKYTAVERLGVGIQQGLAAVLRAVIDVERRRPGEGVGLVGHAGVERSAPRPLAESRADSRATSRPAPHPSRAGADSRAISRLAPHPPAGGGGGGGGGHKPPRPAPHAGAGGARGRAAPPDSASFDFGRILSDLDDVSHHLEALLAKAEAAASRALAAEHSGGGGPTASELEDFHAAKEGSDGAGSEAGAPPRPHPAHGDFDISPVSVLPDLSGAAPIARVRRLVGVAEDEGGDGAVKVGAEVASDGAGAVVQDYEEEEGRDVIKHRSEKIVKKRMKEISEGKDPTPVPSPRVPRGLHRPAPRGRAPPGGAGPGGVGRKPSRPRVPPAGARGQLVK